MRLQDSWHPIRSCLVAVLQRPGHDARVETQACLCLVALLFLLNSLDQTCIEQLQRLLPPSRLILVLRFLAEEAGQDASPYEPTPGVAYRSGRKPCNVVAAQLFSTYASTSPPFPPYPRLACCRFTAHVCNMLGMGISLGRVDVSLTFGCR
jgi:hypothetical protein